METNNVTPTFESVWAALMETDRMTKESKKEMAELRKVIEKTSIEVQNLNKMIGGIQNSNGSFAEEYFFNSFDNDKKDFFGEKFDHIKKNVTSLDNEYDIVLFGGKSVAIVEVKYKAQLKDVPEVIKKAKAFRDNYPVYKNHRIYLGLATLISSENIERGCVKNGIAFVKQVGDTVVIKDEHLKVF